MVCAPSGGGGGSCGEWSSGREAPAARGRPAKELGEGNRIRTALLAAVSHDVRTPLAGIKASVCSLRSDDVKWSEEDRAELLEAIEEGADRLDHLAGDPPDMSRLQTGKVTTPIRVELDIPETLPMVSVDKGLLERVVENAVGYSRRDEPVLVSASAIADTSRCVWSTAGQASPTTPRNASSSPSSATVTPRAARGSAWALAVAGGFAEAMGGTINAEDTPGGGLTMVLSPRMARGRNPGEPETPAAVAS